MRRGKCVGGLDEKEKKRGREMLQEWSEKAHNRNEEERWDLLFSSKKRGGQPETLPRIICPRILRFLPEPVNWNFLITGIEE